MAETFNLIADAIRPAIGGAAMSETSSIPGPSPLPGRKLNLASPVGGVPETRLAELYRHYLPLCVQVARNLLMCEDDAQDAAQEVFTHLLAGGPTSLDRPLGPSFFRVAARNQALRILKRKQVRSAAHGRLQVQHVPDLSTSLTLHDLLAQRHRRRSLQRIFSELPPFRTQVAQLCLIDGFSSSEAAGILGVSTRAVEKQRQKLARDLRRFFAAGGGASGS